MESSKQGEYEETINLRQIIGYQESMNTEEYDRIYENGFLNVLDTPLSTFSIDVDTASYSNIRRYLNANQMPPVDSVRIEEMINYFTYEYPQPQEDELFSVTTDAAVCPWNSEHHLIRIGLQGKVMDANQLAPSNLVFLIDVSGSMNQPNKLPLLKQSLTMLVNHLTENERVAIVVYAGAAGIVLESTPGSAKDKILTAIETLQAGGSTAGGEGIQLAYSIAKENFIEKGNNRVILATDGDFNVGISSDSELIRLIEDEREKGIFLTILGFGTGNYKDNKMEKIADKGNGNYFYIDTENEARKVLSHELGSTLFTIAKDVKLQIEFNPAQIKAYRLIGYENRMLAKEDFNDDTKDAGELGPGHSVTALYEIIRTSSNEEINNVDPLIYQKKDAVVSSDLLTVKFRYKKVDENKSRLVQKSLSTDQITENPLKGFQFAAAVAEFGLLLRNSDFKADASYDSVIEGIENSLDNDKFGYRRELLGLVERAKQIDVRMVEPEINFKGK
ncbi:MAG: VWA domain-containing protein [Candidatus Omnitrophica bacterium]|nr:VWA domain-containing protein [Candidatus Omnitrophota bacterium]